jgi:hypothetical protein
MQQNLRASITERPMAAFFAMATGVFCRRSPLGLSQRDAADLRLADDLAASSS